MICAVLSYSAVAQFCGPQVLGQGVLDSTIGRDEAMIRAYIGTRRWRTNSWIDQLQLKLPSS